MRTTLPRSRKGSHRAGEPGFTGEYWASAAIFTVALLALGIVATTLPRGEQAAAAPSVQIAPANLAVQPHAEKTHPLLDEWFVFLGELCTDPVLLTNEIQVDCERGSLSLSEESFFDRGSPTLREEGKQRLRRAVEVLLARLRHRPRIRSSLEAIEIRGHSDFHAERDPYRTNLVSSQQRAVSVAFFLAAPDTLSEQDREELQALAVVSGVAHSRPPAECPEETRACRARWRRVELRLVLDDTKFRD